MSADPSGSGIRSNVPPRKRFRFALPFFRRAGKDTAATPRVPRRVACSRADCTNTVLDEWEESGLLCAECALEEELCDREARWDRMYPGR
ncbi:MAG: hypothetical protein IPP07_27195 [Holophagales bacterium]|jgi:hypothetical protein|nr:hypothetical protein [Holophagales bacterium]MBK9968352.1 hypothetical protein [Holophagales bacterium]